MILIDLEKCYSCKECKVECNYPFHHYKTGFYTLIEEGIRKIICRHCDDAPCVIACPRNALEKDKNGDIKRATILCTSCKTCLIACPFGVNTIETVSFFTSPCDECKDREKLCIKTCPLGAIVEGEFEEDTSEGIYKIREGVFVKAVHFKKQLGIK
ncbi:MAG: hypothetical protein DRI36_00545 [Caldiserica bacterium]|nr:MAG: hypothetical protein DRI36_00545 [Caldisericota bacterium]